MKVAIFGAGAIGGWMAARLALAGHQVGVVARGATVRFQNGVEPKGLRRLRDPQGRAIRCAGDCARAVDHLHGIGHGHHGNRRTGDQRGQGQLPPVGVVPRVAQRGGDEERDDLDGGEDRL